MRTATCTAAISRRKLAGPSKLCAASCKLDGADLEDVVKVTVYLADARNFGRYNKIFGEYFPDGRVSRTTIEARAVIECKIEMDAVAYKPRS